jgi:hypothetical protein
MTKTWRHVRSPTLTGKGVVTAEIRVKTKLTESERE